MFRYPKFEIRLIYIVISVIIFYGCLYPQSFKVQQYSEQTDLPSAFVYDILQGQNGVIWFATRGGVASFDGNNWRKYRLKDGLSVLPTCQIEADSLGRIWAIGEGSLGAIQVSLYDLQNGDRWMLPNLKHPPDIFYTSITSFQLLEYPEWKTPLLVIGTIDKGLFLLSEKKWECLNFQNGLASDSIMGIAIEGMQIYLATSKGLSIVTMQPNGDYEINNNLYTPSNALPSNNIMGVVIEKKDKFPGWKLPDNRIWICGGQWFGYFYEKSPKTFHLAPAKLPVIEKNEPIRMLPDYQNGIYIGDHYELYYYDFTQNTISILDFINGLIGGGCNSLLIDFEKNIWVACDRGASKISSRIFSNYQQINGLLEDEVTAIIEITHGKVLLGHNLGLSIYNGKEFNRIPFQNILKNDKSISRVLDIKKDSEGNIWMALSWAGLAKFSPKNSQITHYNESDGLPKKVIALFIDHKDNLWIGSEEGLYFSQKGTNRFTPKRIINSNYLNIRKLYGRNGELRFIGTFDSGIYELNNGSWINYRTPKDPLINSIYSIYETPNGQVMIGTLKGLFTIKNKTLIPLKSISQDLNRPIFFILEDKKNRIWFGTDNGVYLWDKNILKHFSIMEGMIGQETNRAAAMEDSRGLIWIGTNRGVSVYNDSFDFSDKYTPIPKLSLTDIEVPGDRIDWRSRKNIEITPLHNYISFSFRGISFSDERAIRFQYKLDGFDKEWSGENYPYNQIIRYPQLPPGHYRFHLKMKSAQNAWSPIVSSPLIIVLQPFYMRWWFIFLMVIAFGFILFSIQRYITQKRYSHILEIEVKERTDQLRAKEQQYRDLFEDSKDMVFITTSEGTFLDINTAGVALFGYDSKEEILKIKSTQQLYKNPEEREKFQNAIETNGFVKDYELEFLRKDGEPIIALLTATLVRDKTGKSIVYRGIIRDITRQKKLEAQLFQAQKMEAIGTLAGGIAHDFNNILGVIMGYSEMALDDLHKDNPIYHSMEQIHVASMRASELVKQILAFSRQNDRERKPLHITPLIKESLKLLRSTIPATIEIRQEINADYDVILADPTQIHQVMMNLCTNAIHAMKDRGGILLITLDELYLDLESVENYKDLRAGDYLRLTVSDTGHGIPEIVMKRIFEPYFTTKQAGEGTGMGLAVIHGIVKSYGGDITVYSEAGRGSTFHIYLPMAQGETVDSLIALQAVPGGSERILLVDDEVMLTRVEARMLKRLGYTVTESSNPEEALELLRKSPLQFDLIFSDITMPRMTGIQLAREAKRISPGIPIILSSGFSAANVLEQLKTLGIDDFVMKPIIKPELARIIRKVLDKRKENSTIR